MMTTLWVFLGVLAGVAIGVLVLGLALKGALSSLWKK
jgi:hypothetical protein